MFSQRWTTGSSADDLPGRDEHARACDAASSVGHETPAIGGRARAQAIPEGEGQQQRRLHRDGGKKQSAEKKLFAKARHVCSPY
jgi:hypothetical protein